MNTTRIRRLLAAAAVAAAAAAAPAAASAQPLNSVAITTGASAGYEVLDVEGGSTALGAKVIQWPGNFGSNQRWNFVTRGDGQQEIVNQRSGMCLTTNGVAGAQLYQWTCNGGARQVWNGDLSYGIAYAYPLTNPATGLRVDVEGGSANAGTRVIAWYANNSDQQSFTYWQLG